VPSVLSNGTRKKAVYRRFAGTGSRPVILEKSGQQFLYRKYDFQHIKGLTPGTEENIALLNDIDTMARKLKQVQDAGVPVLFRPLHEAEGGWFWWGAEGPEPLCQTVQAAL